MNEAASSISVWSAYVFGKVWSSVTELPDTKVSVENSEFINKD